MQIGHLQIQENPIESFLIHQASRVLTIADRTHIAFNDVKTSVINSRLAGSSLQQEVSAVSCIYPLLDPISPNHHTLRVKATVICC
jgi:hypothetical protein